MPSDYAYVFNKQNGFQFNFTSKKKDKIPYPLGQLFTSVT